MLGLVYGTWYAVGNIKDSAPDGYQLELQMQNEQSRLLDYFYKTQKERTVEMLQADTYGGETPEQTLQLFVEALEKKDAKLASKYYLPWKQKEAEKEMRDWIENYPDGLDKFLVAYKKEVIDVEESALDYLVDVHVYKKIGDKYSYRIQMEQNKEASLWKISEF